MNAWNYEADQIEFNSSLRSTDIIDNEEIFNYLSVEDIGSKLFLVGAKGLGKTFLLKAKSKNYRNRFSNMFFLPEDDLCEKIEINHNVFKTRNFFNSGDGFLGSLDTWIRIWNQTLYLSICKNFFPEVISENINQRLGNSKTISDVLQIIIRERFYFCFNRDYEKEFEKIIQPFIKDQKRDILIFIDSLDQTIGEYIQSNILIFNSEEKKNFCVNLWSFSQLGLIHAAKKICVNNKKIKIYATIRAESFEKDPMDTHMQLNQYTTLINYTKKELRQIFELNIKHTEKKRLCITDSDDLFVQFFGSSIIHHSFVNRDEHVFDFINRHTFGRPRELVFIGQALNKILPAERDLRVQKNILNIRKTVNDISHNEVFVQFKREIIPMFYENRLDDFLGKLRYNIFTKRDAEILSIENVKYYYNLGLIGKVKWLSSENKYIQEFLSPNKYNYVDHSLPISDFYFIHPATDGVAIDNKEIIYHKKNIIGYDYDFEFPDETSFSGLHAFSDKQEPISEISKKALKKVNIFIASPNDVSKRSDILFKLEVSFRRRYGELFNDLQLFVDGFEQLPPQQGNPQDLINTDLVSKADIIIAIFKHKLGSPTVDENGKMKYLSGTIEEFYYGLNNFPKKRIITMAYFTKKPPHPSKRQNRSWSNVIKFREDLFKKNIVLVKFYEKEIGLLDILIDDLKNILLKHFSEYKSD